MATKIHNLSFVNLSGREIPKVPTKLWRADRLGAFKARWGVGRMKYAIEPGLYAIGNPNPDSIVLVTANYKLSFDTLRKELGSLNAWIMVLDTKGINVWCSAGKGTFGTDEIVRCVSAVELDKIVNHRTIILPQLAAVGVVAHQVQEQSGFSVVYGPIRASDIIDFLRAGFKATEQMRQVHFSLYDRLVLTPMEFLTGIKYLLLAGAIFFILSGLSTDGYSTDLVLSAGLRSVIMLFIAYFTGSVIAPVLLPWLPGKSFSFKGFSIGLVAAAVLAVLSLTGAKIETIAWIFLFAAVASFVTMNFTGASTYTSLSGVKKEMRIAVPLQLAAVIMGASAWIVARFI